MKTTKAYSYIRWSSEKQTWGDSERRQEQMAQDWCARKGLKLSDRSFTDRGTSAWKGRNLQDGALAELLRVDEPEDVIVIEDNDRFSRQDTITAMDNLRQIVAAGYATGFQRGHNHALILGEHAVNEAACSEMAQTGVKLVSGLGRAAGVHVFDNVRALGRNHCLAR